MTERNPFPPYLGLEPTPASKKPEAYPFLRIAKEHNRPYADILLIADRVTHGRELPGYVDAVRKTEATVIQEIVDAARVQLHVRDGLIDWNTGEPT